MGWNRAVDFKTNLTHGMKLVNLKKQYCSLNMSCKAGIYNYIINQVNQRKYT